MPDDLTRHEALHTAHIVGEMFDNHLLTNDYVTANPDILEAATALSELLAAFYQVIGAGDIDGTGTGAR